MSTRATLKPTGVLGRVVTGATSPNSATKASPSKPKAGSRQKSNPFGAACGAKVAKGLGGPAVPAARSDLVEVFQVANDVAFAAFVDAVFGGEQSAAGREAGAVGV